MKFISVRDLRTTPSQVWAKLAEEKELVLTSNGKPIGILMATSEDTLEEQLAACRQAFAVSAVAAMQERSARTGMDRLAPDDVEEEIRSVRKKRAR